jgi:hypothetical protein
MSISFFLVAKGVQSHQNWLKLLKTVLCEWQDLMFKHLVVVVMVLVVMV